MKKVITTKVEKELAELTGFNGKYVESLLKKVGAATVVDGLRAVKAAAKAAEKATAERFGFKSVKDYRTALALAHEITEAYIFYTGTSMGENRRVKIAGSLFYENTRYCEEYARSSKWRADHAWVNLDFPSPTALLRAKITNDGADVETSFRGVDYRAVMTGKKHRAVLNLVAK